MVRPFGADVDAVDGATEDVVVVGAGVDVLLEVVDDADGAEV